eukprot:m.139365 g.139365  ORF g.139365 m.139365 type:complete len:298 (+) comp11499_c0_seq1:231-1124(+)
MTTLVLGATGTLGSRVASQLLDIGAPVRVGVRSVHKVKALADRGADVAVFDFDKPDTWPAACRGAKTAFFVIPFQEGYSKLAEQVTAAAVAQGVEHITLMSAAGVPSPGQPPSTLPSEIEQQGADTAVATSGLTWSLIKPNFFMSNPLVYQAGSLAAEPVGTFYGASAHQPVSYIDPTDIAAVAVATLQDPAAHHEKEYTLTGPEAVTDDDVATALSTLLGKTIQYIDVSVDDFSAGMKAADPHTPAWGYDQLAAFETFKSGGHVGFVNDTVPKVLGRPARGLADFMASQSASRNPQ